MNNIFSNSLFLIGLVVFLGTLGGEIFKKLKIPKVVGYILIGFILGESILKIVNQHYINDVYYLIVNFTLGIIGFLIGSELKKEVFQKYGKSIYTILISEGFLAFIGVTLIVYLITKKLYLGLLLGAIASATDPASTVSVLWEYKSRGPLTTTLTSIVALDDALALILYGLVSVFSKAMIEHKHFSFLASIAGPILEILESFLLGFLISLILMWIIKKLKDKAIIIALSFSSIAIVVGLAMFLNLDLILSSMVLGLSLTNLMPKGSISIFEDIKNNTSFLYIFFFVIVGASLDIKIFLKISMILIVIGYLIGRNFGKIIGATFGGIISKAKPQVVKYTGICLFTQGGVAVGLAVSLAHSLGYIGENGRIIGNIIISVIAATTFIVQLIGPVFVKYGITKADEAGKNLTEEDIYENYKAEDLMRKDFYPVRIDMTLDKVMEIIKDSNLYHYVVVDRNGDLFGMITLGHMRTVFSEEGLNDVILAEDLAEPVRFYVYKKDSLKKAMEMFQRNNIDFLPVLEEGSKRVAGVLEYRRVVKWVYQEIIKLQHGI